MNRIISLIIGLAGLIIVFLTSLTAEEDKVKTAVLDTVAADSMSWSIPSEVVGRLEVEYEMLQIIVRELSRLKNACEVLRDYQIYPERLTKLNKQRMLNTDKKIEKSEDAIKGFEGEIKVIRRTLEDAIAMTNELISEEPDADMFHTIRDENIQRVKQILEIKHMINNQWDYLMTIIDDLLSYNDVVFEEKLDLKGFDEEFFKLLNATLGKSSENFYKRLNRLKEILIVKAKNEEIKDISQIEIQRVKQRIRAGNYDIAQIQLKSLVRLLQNRITLNTIYYLLGQVQFALGEYNEALKCYKAVEKSSAYYINSRIGLYQTLFRQGEYPTIIDDYEKTPLNIKNSEFHNLLCYFVSESYYRLGNFDKVMTVSNQAKNLIPYYEPNLFILGQTYVKKGDYELAQAIFKKIATNEPQSKTDEAVKTKSKIAMAHLFFLKGRYQEALSQYLSAIDNPEFFSEALYGIAWCYIKTENLQNSELSLKYLINQSPNDLWGAKAMLDLALNFSKRASLEWSYKIALDEDKRKLKNLIRRLNDMNSKLSKEKYFKLKNMLDSLMTDFSKKEGTDNKTIEALYDNAIFTTRIIRKNYNTGIYVENEIKGVREKLLNRIDDLMEQVKLMEHGSVPTNVLRARFESASRKKQFIEIANKAAILEVGMLIEKEAWQDMSYQRSIDELRNKILETPHNKKLVVAPGQSPILMKQYLKKTMEDFIREHIKIKQKNRGALLEIMEKLDITRMGPHEQSFMNYLKGELLYKTIGEKYLIQDSIYETQREVYERLLLDYRKGKIKNSPLKPDIPVIDYAPCIKLFDEVIKNYENNLYHDAALYSKMFCYFEEGLFDKARELGEQLVKNYPQSSFAPQTYMILGEYYFDRNQLENAKEKYKKILDFPQTRLFDKALYKLGWTHYKLYELKDAIKIFAYLIMEGMNINSDIVNKMLISDVFKNSDLVKEAIAYIAISYAESDTINVGEERDGIVKCKKFCKRLSLAGYDEIGAKIMQKLGDVYRDMGKFNDAYESYEYNLITFPNYKNAPVVKLEQIYILERKGDFSKANELKVSLFKEFNHKGKWAKAINDSEKIAIGDSVAEIALQNAANYYFSQAMESKSKGDYLKVINLYKYYVQTWPQRADKEHYNIAELFYQIEDYSNAAETYLEVSKRYPQSKLKENAAWNAVSAAQRYHQTEIFREADQLNSENKPEMAIEKLKELLRWYPNSYLADTAMYQMIMINIRNKKFKEARDIYEQLLNEYPSSKKLVPAHDAIKNGMERG